MEEERHHTMSGWKKATDYMLDVVSTVTGVTNIGMELAKRLDASKGAGPVAGATPVVTLTDEQKAALYGKKGWGDEHDYIALRRKVKPDSLATWDEFIVAMFMGRDGAMQQNKEDETLTALRICITSMDKAPIQIGSETITFEGTPRTLKSGATKTTKKEWDKKPLFGSETKNGAAFIESCAAFIDTTRDERFKECSGGQTNMNRYRKESLMAFSTAYAHVELVRQFRSIGLPTMPLDEEFSRAREIDEGLKALKELPHEMVSVVHGFFLSRRNARIGRRQVAKATGLSVSRLVWRVAVCTMFIALFALLISLAVHNPSQHLN